MRFILFVSLFCLCLLSLMDVYVKRQSFTSSLHHQNWNPNRKNKWDSQGSEKSQIPQLVCRISRNDKCSLILETKGSCCDFWGFLTDAALWIVQALASRLEKLVCDWKVASLCRIKSSSIDLNLSAPPWCPSVWPLTPPVAPWPSELRPGVNVRGWWRLSHQLIIFTSFKQEVLMAVNGATWIKV